MKKLKIPQKRVCTSIACMKRHEYHPDQHTLRKKHAISKRTFFYMKEYGPHSHLVRNIVFESLKVLVVASILSTFGGVAMRSIEGQLRGLIPLLILLPALSGAIGNFGTIMASKFTTALFEGHIHGAWWKIHFLHRLFAVIGGAALVTSFYIGTLAVLFGQLQGFVVTMAFVEKVMFTSVVTTMLLVGVILLISVMGGLWIYRKGEDPNNFLIPITTSLADLGSLVVFTYLVTVLF